MTGTPDDRFDDGDLDRLLAHLPPPPPMGSGLVDRVVAEAQRTGRTDGTPAAGARRLPRRAWTRRGVWTGVIAVNLIFASAVAAAFGGGVLSVATIRAAAARIVEHIHHPHRHPVATPHPVPVAVHPAYPPPPADRSIGLRQPGAGSVPGPISPAGAVAPIDRLPVRHEPLPSGRAAIHSPMHRILPPRPLRDAQRHRLRIRPGRPEGDTPPKQRTGTPPPGWHADMPSRAGRAIHAGERPEAMPGTQWQRPDGPMADGFGRPRRFGGGLRQGLWGRAPRFGARRFGPALGPRLGPGPRRPFGPRGNRRPFRRRF